MGLSASQARLLLLTARQNDVEGQMMSISNQKLSLARQSADLSENYNRALNATCLTWDTGDKSVDLNYDLIMHPNTTQTTGQYLLSNASTGAVILDDSYISTLNLGAAGGAGDIATKYTATQFVAKMMGIAADNTTLVADMAKIITTPPPSNGNSTQFKTSYNDSDIYTALSSKTFKCLSTSWEEQTLYYNTSGSSQVVCFFQSDGKNLSAMETSGGAAATNLASLVGSITGSTSEAVLKNLEATGKYSSAIKSTLESAASKAQVATRQFYEAKLTSIQNNPAYNAGNSETVNKCAGTNQIYNDSYGRDELYLDVSQVIKTFLNYFDGYCSSLDNDSSNTSYDVFAAQNGASTSTRGTKGGTGTECSDSSTTQTPSGTTANDTLNSNSISDSYEEKYYYNLYNALNTYGWQSNSSVDDPDYLQSQILYGSIALKSVNSSGQWSTVSTNDSNSPITSESDKDAIAQAEAEYEAEKDKLDYKESQLDISMNNLDSERSAIETETESVQKIIDKNIERSFKLFDA